MQPVCNPVYAFPHCASRRLSGLVAHNFQRKRQRSPRTTLSPVLASHEAGNQKPNYPRTRARVGILPESSTLSNIHCGVVPRRGVARKHKFNKEKIMKVRNNGLTRVEAKALSLLLNVGWAQYECSTGQWSKRWLKSGSRATDKIRARAGRKPGEPVGLDDPLFLFPGESGRRRGGALFPLPTVGLTRDEIAEVTARRRKGARKRRRPIGRPGQR